MMRMKSIVAGLVASVAFVSLAGACEMNGGRAR